MEDYVLLSQPMKPGGTEPSQMADCLEVGCCCELHTDSRPSLNMSSIVIVISLSKL